MATLENVMRHECSRCNSTGRRYCPAYDRENANAFCKNCDGDGYWYSVPAADILPIPIDHPRITMNEYEFQQYKARFG